MLNWSKAEKLLIKKNETLKKIIMLKKSNELNIKSYCSDSKKDIYKSDYFRGIADNLKSVNKELKDSINCALRECSKNRYGVNVSTLMNYKEVI